MDLIVTGMALSLQWTPSLRQAEYCLSGKYQPLPSLVEHPGEVLQKALQDIERKSRFRLIHIHLGPEAEFGSYSSLLDGQFQAMEKVDPASSLVGRVLIQAADLCRETDSLVVISETTRSGTAAVVLSHPEAPAPGIARVRSWPIEEKADQGMNYVGVASTLDDDNLTRLLANGLASQDPYPVTLGTFNAPRPGGEALPVLIQTVLALKNKVIPAWFDGQPVPLLPQEGTDLLFPARSRPWLPSGPDFKRRAVFAQLAPGEAAWELLGLEEIPRATDLKEIRTVPGLDPLLFPLSGNQAQDLLDQLEDLEKQLAHSGSLKNIAQNAYTKYAQNKGQLTCCLVGLGRESLEKEISHSKTGIVKALETGRPWSSPAGSHFTPQPLGKAEIAFVYPGAFNSYPDMARDLFFTFPGLMDAAQEIIPDLSHSLAEEFLYLNGPGHDQDPREDQRQVEFLEHPNQLIESGISLSVLYTLLLKEVFQVKPQAALGYSLGEASMLWANQVWQNVQDGSDSWRQSSLFKDRLVGDMKAVRSFWNRDLPQDFWSSFILKDSSERVEKACQAEPLVFLTIRNTPEELVIAGEKAACQRVIESLGCRALPMPFNNAIHNPAVASCYPDFLELYSNPTHSVDGIRFYTAADYQELRLSQDNIAQKMAQMTTSPIDFSRLVSRVYDSGARIFIEVGPQKTCSRWIERILAGKPHAVVPINKRYQPDFLGVLKVLSLLISQGAELDLSPLYHSGKSTRTAGSRSAARQQTSPGLKQPAPDLLPSSLRAAYFQQLDLLSDGMIRSHQSYLTEQHKITKSILKLAALQDGFTLEEADQPSPEALYTRQQIEAFTLGDPADCFGDLFRGFQNRRIPRLPNGPLQFLDRVTNIDGILGEIKPGSTLVSEFDPAQDAWYTTPNSGSLPHVALMEIALQPCGFLSAYMGSILGREDQDLYFRNLDGEAALLEQPDPRGGPITNRVELLSSSSLGDVIIQKYSFELSQGGRPFFTGSSSFGYFTPQMLRNQTGLDGEKDHRPWQDHHPDAGSWKDFRSISPSLNGTPALPSLERAWIAPQGGDHQQGYLLLSQLIPPHSWFYAAHFHQDPVMPGSLGVELMSAAVQAASSQWDVPGNLSWQMAASTGLEWKYRGQITPDIREITVDLHVKSLTKKGPGWEITADGQLWKGAKRIYLVENLCLEAYPAGQEIK